MNPSGNFKSMFNTCCVMLLPPSLLHGLSQENFQVPIALKQ